MIRRIHLCTPLFGITLVGCASTGATFGSGVGDRFLERPPFYAGSLSAFDTGTAIAYFPVAYQRGASQPAIFDPGEAAVEALLDEMSEYLDRAGFGALVEGDVTARGYQPPDVRFGCTTNPVDDDECVRPDDGGALGRGSQPMHLRVGRPSPDWVAETERLMLASETHHVLVVTLEVGQYWIRQRGLRGTKEVELGTRHVVHFPWLTSLEGPVSVLQLTGALVGRDGRAVRIGAEGLLARRTSMTVSALGGQALVTEAEIEQLRTARRDDIEGRPLVWQIALRSLVEQLTGRSLPADPFATLPE